MGLYALALIGRAGLGNELFPWARAEMFARRSGARVLAPRWARFRLGPYLRREPEKRRYSGMFEAAHHVRGFVRESVLVVARRLPEEGLANADTQIVASLRPCIVEFSGIGDMFLPLSEEYEFIRNQLWNMTKPSLRSMSNHCGERFIAMHVRRGDITRQGFTRDELNAVNQYTPIGWFVSMAVAVRKLNALRNVPIVVFTDGSREEVAELSAIEGVDLREKQPAITDLWAMSRAALLFASGFSTFGMWASYLGGMPTVYAKGKIQQGVLEGRHGVVEIEVPINGPIPDAAFARIFVRDPSEA